MFLDVSNSEALSFILCLRCPHIYLSGACFFQIKPGILRMGQRNHLYYEMSAVYHRFLDDLTVGGLLPGMATRWSEYYA